MKVHIKEEECVLLILDYLRQRRLFHALHALETETNVRLETYGAEAEFLRNLLMEGAFEDALAFLKPLEHHHVFDYQRAVFLVKKQRFLEMVAAERLSPAVVELVDGLKELEPCCSKEEFNTLCYCLSLKKLQDHPEYRDWTIHRGRMECFEVVKPLLLTIYDDESSKRNRKEVARMEPNRLVKLMQDALMLQIGLYRAKYKEESSGAHLTTVFASLLVDFPASSSLPHVDGETIRRPTVASFTVDPIADRPRSDSSSSSGPSLAVAQSVQLPPRSLLHGKAALPQPRAGPSSSVSDLSTRPILAALDAAIATPPQPNSRAEQRVPDAVPAEPSGPKKASPPAAKGVSYFISQKELEETLRQPSPPPPPSSSSSFSMPSSSLPAAPRSHPPKQAPAVAMRQPRKGFRFREPPCGCLEDAQAIRSVAFSPDGSFFAVGSNSKVLRMCILDPSTAAPVVQFEKRSHHLGSIYCADVAVIPSGSSPSAQMSHQYLVATGSNDRSVKLCRVEGGGLQLQSELVLGEHNGTVRDLCFLPGGGLRDRQSQLLVSCGAGEDAVRVWDVERLASTLVIRGQKNVSLYSGACSRDSPFLYACGASDGCLRTYDLRIGQLVHEIECDGLEVFACRWSPLGIQRIYGGLSDGRIVACDGRMGIIESFLSVHQDECRSLDFDLSGRYLLSCSFDRSLAVVDTETGLLVDQFVGHSDKAITARWHPVDSDLVVSSGADRRLCVWRNQALSTSSGSGLP